MESVFDDAREEAHEEWVRRIEEEEKRRDLADPGWRERKREQEQGIAYGPIRNTSYWVRLSELHKNRLVLMSGLVIDLVDKSPITGSVASIAIALWGNVKKLDEDELEIMRILRRVTDGDIYRQWVVMEELIDAAPPDRRPHHYEKLLASMKGKGLLEESSGMWRAIR